MLLFIFYHDREPLELQHIFVYRKSPCADYPF